MASKPNGLDNDDFKNLQEFETLKDTLDFTSRGTTLDLVYVASAASSGLILGRDVQLAEGFDVRKRDYYQAAIAAPGKPVISEPRVSAEVSAEPIIVITGARTIADAAGTTAGIAAFNYRLTPIINLLKDQMKAYSVKISFYDTQGGYLLWRPAKDKDYYYDPKNRLAIESLFGEFGLSDSSAEYAALKTDLLAKDSHFFEASSESGGSMIQALRIPDSRWAILVEFPRQVVVRDVLSSILPTILLFSIAFTLAQLGVFLLLNRSVVAPLVLVGRNLGRLAQADADLTLSLPVQSKDEIGALAGSFNSFIAKLRDLMVDIRHAIDKAGQVKENLSSTTEETSASIEEISANLASIRKQIETLDSSISDNVSSIQQISVSISRVDDQIVNQSSMVEESTAAITQMIASLSNVNAIAQNKRRTTQALSEVAADGKEKIEETAIAFHTVVGNIQQIQEMADAINGIAAQTNLLSMNAAIEAAHAGDAGRGFAVVAEEIRKLADSAGQSSHTIAGLIKDISSSVQETETNVGRTSQAFERISQEVGSTVNAFAEIEQSVAELNLGGKQILESTNQINEVTVHIRDGSREIKSGTANMLSSSSKIKEVSDRVTTGMVEASQGSTEIVSTMQLLVHETQDLNAIIEDLKAKFGLFKT